jgi:hypothetical protein
MAVVNRTSTAVTNATATPPTTLNPVLNGSRLQEKIGVITPAADDTQASIGRFCRVPSNARISQLLFNAADATTAGAIDIGVYQTAANGGAVVDADLFVSALDLAGGPYMNLDVTRESGEYTIAESEKPLWEVLGLTSDPGREYDIAYTITTTFNGGPTVISLLTRFVQ